MPFDGSAASASLMRRPSAGAGAAPVHTDMRRESPAAIRLTSMRARYSSRRAASVASTIAVLRRARNLVADEQRWCKGSFARTWFGIPVSPQSALARRFCAIGAIMRAGRELQLRTQDACLVLQWQMVRPVEDWNDLIAALISVAAIAGFTAVGSSLSSTFTNVSSKL